MKNSFGNSVIITLFGESHGKSVGAVLDGIAPGIPVDNDFIRYQLSLRRPSESFSTSRIETDEFEIHSGIFNGKTTGTPICIIIPNKDTDSSAYDKLKGVARPGHADFTSFSKYKGFADYRGGGHSSGRVTAALVAAGAIAVSMLKSKNIFIGTHLAECAGVHDRGFDDLDKDIKLLNSRHFAALDEAAAQKMKDAVNAAHERADSVGAVLETAVTGVPAGAGEPWFDSVEGMLSHILFSVPGIKGVEFGSGFRFASAFGSEMNDAFFAENGNVFTKTNHNGGINGGITNGMPLVFRCAVKPTPSVGIKQSTVNFEKCENRELIIDGRHDACIADRARVVIDSVTALALCDILSQKYGTDFFGE